MRSVSLRGSSVTPSTPESGMAAFSDRAPHPADSQSFDTMVADALPPILGVLAVLYLVLSGAHALLVPPPAGPILVGVAASSSAIFVAAWLLLRRFPIPAGLGHATAALAAAVVLVNGILHLSVTEDPIQTTNLILLVLGVGVIFLDFAWFGVIATLTFAGWILVARQVPQSGEWIHFGFTLVFSTVLAGTVLYVRLRNFRHIAELRRKERLRQLELESALAQNEAARKGEEEARRAMEGAVVQLKESEERFRRLADASFEGVLILAGTQVVDANSHASALFDEPVGELVGGEVEEWIPPDQRPAFQDLLEGARASGRRATTRELEGLRRDGSRFPMDVSVLPASHRGQKGFVLVARDITDQKRAETFLRQALEEAEASSRAKSAFLANMSHELRTPLNAVIGFANILLKRSADRMPEREVDFLRRIVANGEHLLALINDILDLSKIDAQRMEVFREPVDLEELVEEVVETFEIQARRKGVRLETELPPGLPPVVADSRRLHQILLNLVGNAVKFTPEGRVVLRVVAEGEPPRATRVEVEDTGIGIPRDQLEDIFTPFQQIDESSARSFGGTGLGLAISRSLSQLMGFDLEVSSREGQGSVFSVVMERRFSREERREGGRVAGAE